MSNSSSPATHSMPMVKGASVVAADGAKVGTSREYDALNHYLLVEHGWLEPLLIHVPLYAITHSDTRRIHLAVSKDDALNGRWPTLPVNITAGNGAAGGQGGAAPPHSAPAISSALPPSSAPAVSDAAPPATIHMPGGDASAAGTPSAGTPSAPPPPMAVVTPIRSNQDTSEVRIPIVEERLVVSTRQGQTGAVRVHKDVIEEQQTVLVTLRHEVVTVEHVPVTGTADAAAVTIAMTAQDFVIPLMAEQAVVTKEARIVEEVRLHKQDVAEEQPVSETVRKTRVSVDGLSRSAQDGLARSA